MLRVIEIKKTCEAVPAQWEGMDTEGRPVYVRYRWGYLSVRVGEKGADIFSAVRGQEILGKEVGDSMDGVMTYDELKTEAAGIVEFPSEEAT